jgi:hypothetical protein
MGSDIDAGSAFDLRVDPPSGLVDQVFDQCARGYMHRCA